MREVVSVHLGQAGVQLGTAVWELYNHEHNISADGEQIPPVASEDYKLIFDATTSFYRPLNCSNYYEPRAVFADLDPTVIDNISRTKLNKMVQSDFLLKGSEDAANNFARGNYTIGRSMLPQLADAFRRQVESSDSFQGSMMFRSMGGGTGSGLGTRVVEFLVNEFPKKALIEIAVFPSPKTSTVVVEPYNTVLASTATLEMSKCVIFNDNEAIYNMTNENNGASSTLTVNNILSQAVSSVTSGLRGEGSMKVDLFDYQTNLIPYPLLHFPVMSVFPAISSEVKELWSLKEITTKVFSKTYRMAEFPGEGDHLARCLLYRGDVSASEAVNSLNMKRNGKEPEAAMTKCFKVGVTTKSPAALVDDSFVDMKHSACVVSNNTGLQTSWKRLGEKYRLLLSKCAFLHWYVSEGMDVAEFNEAGEKLEVILDKYRKVTE